MSDHDPRLAELLSDAVSDIEPADHLDAIRDRTKVIPMTSRRPWYLVAGGAAIATAAVITAIALASNQDSPSVDPLPPGTSPTGAVDPTPTGGSTDPAVPTLTVAGYYLGATSSGTGLYREFIQVPANDPLSAAVLALETAPSDPDYRTPWPAGSFSDAGFDGVGDNGVVSVVLADASLHDRPAGMSQAEAEAAIQQVVYTLQAAVRTRAPVQFMFNGNPIDQVLGVPTSEPLANASPLATLSHVSISDPAEGASVSGSLEANGVANSFEANVGWEIRQGDQVISNGSFMADGYMDDKLFPWHTTIDISSLAPGTYTFAVMEDDPSAGAEGNGPDTDTRTIVVE
ncbi:Gmad2 immunoglobulin-like domain-containing protein [Nocardioides sp.]|uniref:Gmad2 immunoglobulin-like domain-containing protein n=1 Tax=Nocardioides sp. TaxID=35761 RepID=UPI0031FE943B|nr:hypothetical protein [Nocardioides sp.]